MWLMVLSAKTKSRHYINKVKTRGTGNPVFVKVFRGFWCNFYDII